MASRGGWLLAEIGAADWAEVLFADAIRLRDGAASNHTEGAVDMVGDSTAVVALPRLDSERARTLELELAPDTLVLLELLASGPRAGGRKP